MNSIIVIFPAVSCQPHCAVRDRLTVVGLPSWPSEKPKINRSSSRCVGKCFPNFSRDVHVHSRDRTDFRNDVMSVLGTGTARTSGETVSSIKCVYATADPAGSDVCTRGLGRSIRFRKREHRHGHGLQTDRRGRHRGYLLPVFGVEPVRSTRQTNAFASRNPPVKKR